MMSLQMDMRNNVLAPAMLQGFLVRPNNIALPENGLQSRGISAAACKALNVWRSIEPQKVVEIVTDIDGNETGYHYRIGGWYPGTPKEQGWELGSIRHLLGLCQWDGTQKPVILYEGATDAMRGYDMWGEEYYHLALLGAPSQELLLQFLAEVDYVSGTHQVVLAFDNDSTGDNYCKQWYPLLKGKHTVLRADIPTGVKDICDCKEVPKWVSYPPLPVDLLSGDLLEAEVLTPDGTAIERKYITTGLLPLDNLVGGYAEGQLLLIAAPDKAGKTTLVTSLAALYLQQHQQSVMFISLEMVVSDVFRWVANSYATYTSTDFTTSVRAIKSKCIFPRAFGYCDISKMEEWLDACVQLDCKFVVIDHITAAATHGIDGLSTTHLDALLYTLQAKVNEHKLTLLAVSHISGDAETSYVTRNNLRGSRSLSQVPEMVLGIRRDIGGSELYSITPHRFTGKVGKFSYEVTDHVVCYQKVLI